MKRRATGCRSWVRITERGWRHCFELAYPELRGTLMSVRPLTNSGGLSRNELTLNGQGPVAALHVQRA